MDLYENKQSKGLKNIHFPRKGTLFFLYWNLKNSKKKCTITRKSVGDDICIYVYIYIFIDGPEIPQIPLWITMWQYGFMFIWWLSWIVTMLRASFVLLIPMRHESGCRDFSCWVKGRCLKCGSCVPFSGDHGKTIRLVCPLLLVDQGGFRSCILIKLQRFAGWCKQFAYDRLNEWRIMAKWGCCADDFPMELADFALQCCSRSLQGRTHGKGVVAKRCHRLPSWWLPAVAGVVGIVRHKSSGLSVVLGGSLLCLARAILKSSATTLSIYLSVLCSPRTCWKMPVKLTTRSLDWRGRARSAEVEPSDCLYQINHAPDPVRARTLLGLSPWPNAWSLNLF